VFYFNIKLVFRKSWFRLCFGRVAHQTVPVCVLFFVCRQAHEILEILKKFKHYAVNIGSKNTLFSHDFDCSNVAFSKFLDWYRTLSETILRNFQNLRFSLWFWKISDSQTKCAKSQILRQIVQNLRFSDKLCKISDSQRKYAKSQVFTQDLQNFRFSDKMCKISDSQTKCAKSQTFRQDVQNGYTFVIFMIFRDFPQGPLRKRHNSHKRFPERRPRRYEA